MPARLTDIKNVKDFGALGDGTGALLNTRYGSLAAAQAVYPFVTNIATQTIDWAAITAAWMQFNGPSADNKGIVYFPPGTYVVDEPVDFTGTGNANPIWRGDLGISTVKGNFADYVFKRTANFSNLNAFEKLNIVNTNATGGGIRSGGGDNISIRDCTVTANQGISTFNSDSITGGAYFGSLECTIESCVLSPGSNVAGSQGIMVIADGPIINCRIIGYETGLLSAAGEGAMNVLGCYFESCTTGILLGVGPDGQLDVSLSPVIAGCSFKNCSVAISSPHSAALLTLVGIHIEGANGQAPGGLNPQYGLLDGSSNSTIGNSLIAGISVVGNYDGVGMYFPGSSQGQTNLVAGVQSVSWNVSPQPGQAADRIHFLACNVAPVYTFAQLPGANEGDCYNISDGTNSLAWGATVTNTGSHTTHYKARYNGSNYTVVGQ